MFSRTLRHSLVALLAGLLPLAVAGVEAADDNRQMVSLPPPMQEHMLANMRDHVTILDQVLGLVAAEKFRQASELAEARLGMSSLGLHGAAHMAPFMPQPMQDIGTTMHRAASRFALVATDADVKRSYESMREVTSALHEVTATCAACHAGFRIR
jgi:hypothetical protein